MGELVGDHVCICLCLFVSICVPVDLLSLGGLEFDA